DRCDRGGTLQPRVPGRDVAVEGDALVVVRLLPGLALERVQPRPRVAALDPDVARDAGDPMPGARHVTGAGDELHRLVDHALGLDQLTDCRERAREDLARGDGEAREDVALGLG